MHGRLTVAAAMALALLAGAGAPHAVAEEPPPGERCPSAVAPGPSAFPFEPICGSTDVTVANGSRTELAFGSPFGYLVVRVTTAATSPPCALVLLDDARGPFQDAEATACAAAPALPEAPRAEAPRVAPPDVAPSTDVPPIPSAPPATAPPDAEPTLTATEAAVARHRTSAHVAAAEGALTGVTLATSAETPAGGATAAVAHATTAPDGGAAVANTRNAMAPASTEPMSGAAPAPIGSGTAPFVPQPAPPPRSANEPARAPTPQPAYASSATIAEATPRTDAARVGLAAAGLALVGAAVRVLSAAALALYHRISGHAALKHETRARLAEALRDGPATVSELARRLDANRKTIEYHLRLMESLGLVTSWSVGHERQFASAHAKPPPTDVSRGAVRVLEAVREQPGGTLGSVARRLGVSKGTAHHHVRRLQEAGLVRVERRADGALALHPPSAHSE